MKLDILAFEAHPGDVKLGAGDTIAKKISLGKTVGIIDLTQGELSTRGSAEIRYQEATKIKEPLGVAVHENLKLRDGSLMNDETHRLAVIKKIRQHQPNIILCNAIDDRHIDHGKDSRPVSDACFLGGLHRIEATLDDKAQSTWRPKVAYHYIQWKNIIPDFVVDITGFMGAKVNAVLAHNSQFYDSSSNKPTTPISDRNLLDSVAYRARGLRRLIGTDFTGGSTRERAATVGTPLSLK